MIDMARAACALDAAVDQLEDRLDRADQAGARGLVDIARDCFDRGDWTGAWLAAGSALGLLDVRLTRAASVG